MIDREARRRLHHKLIDLQDKPCEWCGTHQGLEIDRIVEGFRGGRYTMTNSRVLCRACHDLRHRQRKFEVGDTVQINGRCPNWLVSQLRHNRARTVTSVYYDSRRKCCYYYLGNNKRGSASADLEAYSFRSYMLHYPKQRGVGRPKTKRSYTESGLKCTVTAPNQQSSPVSGKSIPEHLAP